MNNTKKARQIARPFFVPVMSCQLPLQASETAMGYTFLIFL